MNTKQFAELTPGIKLADENGRVLYKMANDDLHYIYFCVFDTRDGKIKHFSQFKELRVSR